MSWVVRNCTTPSARLNGWSNSLCSEFLGNKILLCVYCSPVLCNTAKLQSHKITKLQSLQGTNRLKYKPVQGTNCCILSCVQVHVLLLLVIQSVWGAGARPTSLRSVLVTTKRAVSCLVSPIPTSMQLLLMRTFKLSCVSSSVVCIKASCGMLCCMYSFTLTGGGMQVQGLFVFASVYVDALLRDLVGKTFSEHDLAFLLYICLLLHLMLQLI